MNTYYINKHPWMTSTALCSSKISPKRVEHQVNPWIGRRTKETTERSLHICSKTLRIEHRSERLGGDWHQYYVEGAMLLRSNQRSSHDPIQKHQLHHLQPFLFPSSVFLLGFLWNSPPKDTCWNHWNSNTASWLLLPVELTCPNPYSKKTDWGFFP